MDRIKDYLLMEEEFVVNQERLKPQEDKNVEERTKVDELRGTPMHVGTLEEIIDDDHAIVSTSHGPGIYAPFINFKSTMFAFYHLSTRTSWNLGVVS
jgi:26S proteasome regulatory subunit T2